MKMNLRAPVLRFAIIAMLPSLAYAEEPAPPGYNEAVIGAGGQSDAVSLVCGKTTLSQAIAHKAVMKRLFAARGVASARFDTMYDTAFNQVKAKAQANPAQTKLQCAQFAKGMAAHQ